MTHSVHLPGSGHSVWLPGSYVLLQDLVRGRGLCPAPGSCQRLDPLTQDVPNPVAGLWRPVTRTADPDNSTGGCVAWSLPCVPLLAWPAPRLGASTLASFLPEDIVVPAPGTMAFLGNAQGRLGGEAGAGGREGWEGPQTGERALLPGSPSRSPTQRGQRGGALTFTPPPPRTPSLRN